MDAKNALLDAMDPTAPALDKRGRPVLGTCVDDGEELPASDVGSDVEIEAGPGLLEVEAVLRGPFLDEKGQRVYLCAVNGEDDVTGEYFSEMPWVLRWDHIHK
mmetsp:Transcript_38522/g.79015  ORF Transcript_38522/g.79015 Transcript_38522/m.79015 type:complete len:103 (-) Transcript_38522:1316-1624(-)